MPTRKKIMTAPTSTRLTNTSVPVIDTNGDLSEVSGFGYAGGVLIAGSIKETAKAQGVGALTTNTTAEEILASYLIPANTLGNNDIILVETLWDLAGRTAVINCRIRLHTSLAIGGTVYMNRAAIATSVNSLLSTVRIHEKNANNKQVAMVQNTGYTEGTSTSAVQTSILSTTAAMYVIITSQKTAGTDVTVDPILVGYSISIIRV